MTPREGSIRFTIRAVLWAKVVGALTGWYTYHRKASESCKNTIEKRDNARLLGGGLITTRALMHTELKARSADFSGTTPVA